MVRVKKRYFVLRLERQSEVEARGRGGKGWKRALSGERPLNLGGKDGDGGAVALAGAAKEAVHLLHGDFGRASVTVGLRGIYCNPATGAAILACRHGPHRLLASALPFVTRIREERVVPTLIYTGATVRQCYKKLENFQRRELRLALQELANDPKCLKERKILEEKMKALSVPKTT